MLQVVAVLSNNQSHDQFSSEYLVRLHALTVTGQDRFQHNTSAASKSERPVGNACEAANWLERDSGRRFELYDLKGSVKLVSP